jgi:hypothetical protein
MSRLESSKSRLASKAGLSSETIATRVFLRTMLSVMHGATLRKQSEWLQGSDARLEYLRDAGHMPEHGGHWCESHAVISGKQWPSWLPDWSVRSDPSIKCDNGRRPPNGPNASGSRASKAEIFGNHVHTSENPNPGPCLSSLGIIVLVVKCLFPEPLLRSFATRTEAYPSTTMSYMDAYRRLGRYHYQYTSTNEKEEALASSRFWNHIKELEMDQRPIRYTQLRKLSYRNLL